jgi:hypothetical protein
MLASFGQCDWAGRDTEVEALLIENQRGHTTLVPIAEALPPRMRPYGAALARLFRAQHASPEDGRYPPKSGIVLTLSFVELDPKATCPLA